MRGTSGEQCQYLRHPAHRERSDRSRRILLRSASGTRYLPSMDSADSASGSAQNDEGFGGGFKRPWPVMLMLLHVILRGRSSRVPSPEILPDRASLHPGDKGRHPGRGVAAIRDPLSIARSTNTGEVREAQRDPGFRAARGPRMTRFPNHPSLSGQRSFLSAFRVLRGRSFRLPTPDSRLPTPDPRLEPRVPTPESRAPSPEIFPDRASLHPGDKDRHPGRGVAAIRIHCRSRGPRIPARSGKHKGIPGSALRAAPG